MRVIIATICPKPLEIPPCYKPSARMRERVTVVTLFSVTHSVCVSLFDFGEGAVFRVETSSIYSR